MPDKQPFSVFETELVPGSNLIEAGAGTGKTFAIAMMVVRLMVEKQCAVDSIIVTTFTKAATAELRERIRSRIRQCLLLARGQNELVDDEALSHWFEQLPQQVQSASESILAEALLEIDMAAIYTIHSFCQRMLIDFALESGQLFNLELTEDPEALFEQVAEDYWRQYVYEAHPFVVGLLLDKYKTPNGLLKSVRNGYGIKTIYPKPDELENFEPERFDQLKGGAVKALSELAELLQNNQDKFKQNEWNRYQQVLNQPDFIVHHTGLFTQHGVLEALNGNKFKKNKDKSSIERKEAFIAEYNIDFTPFQALDDYVEKISKDILLQYRLGLLNALKAEVPRRLFNNNQTSFDSLVEQLASAIDRDGGELINGLRARFKAALIDEFQDTDPDQWAIFSRVFLPGKTTFLYMIGDPKQAVYKFRGADVFTYLQVARQVDRGYTLNKNWRSHPGIVEGVNQLFSIRNKPFVIEDFTFEPNVPAKHANDGQVVDQHGDPVVPMQLLVYKQPTKDKHKRAELLVAKISALLNGPYKIVDKQGESFIQASNIAILARSNSNAQCYRQALWEADIPATITRSASVFHTEDAKALLMVLSAVCYPNDLSYIRTMLSCDYFGLDAVRYYNEYVQSEAPLDALLERFESYHHDWHKKGFMHMMTGLIEQEGINQQLLKQPRAERRLTDLNHLLEIIQQQITEHNLGPHKTIEWLQQQIISANDQLPSAQAQKIRLESERQAVSIVTMHSAKGLEYPIVFCPDLSDSLRSDKDELVCFNKQGQMQAADLGSAAFEQHKDLVFEENLSEEMRLLYVAITRAELMCFICFECIENPKGSRDKNPSPLSYLFDLSEVDYQNIVDQYSRLSDIHPAIFHYECVDIEMLETGNTYQARRTLHTDSPQPPPVLETIPQHWQLTSFTGLSRIDVDSSRDCVLPAEDEPVETIQMSANQSDVLYEDLPKGAAVGNIIHDMLETFDFISFTQPSYKRQITNTIKQLCLKYSVDADYHNTIERLLEQCVKAPIGLHQSDDCTHQFRLVDLRSDKMLKEMPFHMALKPFHTKALNDLFKNEDTVKPIGYKEIEGLLVGFIDLIFCYQGQYYVTDYKSNTLPAYDQDSLIQAMQAHNYGLQWWIYTAVLDQYLMNVLPGYDYDQHFGGVYYLFVRGMRVDRSGEGIYFSKPPKAKLAAFKKLICSKKDKSHA